MTPEHRPTQGPDVYGQLVSDFSEFYRETMPGVLRSAMRVAPDPESARDATQEAYTRMLERWTDRQWHQTASNRNYVLSIAVNLILDGYRKAKRVRPLLDDEELPHEGDDPMEIVVSSLGGVDPILHFIASQPIQRRAAAVLRLIEDWEYKDIATKLGMAESTVRTHVSRVVIPLRAYLVRLASSAQGGK